MDRVALHEAKVFARQFTASPRGARLARRLALRQLQEWGYPLLSDTSCTVSLLVGELSANAARHGKVPGRNFHLRLSMSSATPPETSLIRIEVSDANPELPLTSPVSPDPDEESGRGLLMVDFLATRWGVSPREPLGKTVWAEFSAPARPTP